MLRVGLTGGLGSGKSTVAGFFSELGAAVISADQIGHDLMRPGEQVYKEIVRAFGPEVVLPNGLLDRRTLAKLAFQGGRGEELSRIVHPAAVAEQARRTEEVFARDPDAVVIVESALIFEADRSGTAPGWRARFDRLILVTAPEQAKIDRFVYRALAASPRDETPEAIEARRADLERDARARLAAQIPDREKAPLCDFVIRNSGSIQETRDTVRDIYFRLEAESIGRILTEPPRAEAPRAE